MPKRDWIVFVVKVVSSLSTISISSKKSGRTESALIGITYGHRTISASKTWKVSALNMKTPLTIHLINRRLLTYRGRDLCTLRRCTDIWQPQALYRERKIMWLLLPWKDAIGAIRAHEDPRNTFELTLYTKQMMYISHSHPRQKTAW